MLIFIIILAGISLGSFGNNIISFFLGRAEFDLFRSRCFCGEKILKNYELIPIFSYVMLRGKCSGCERKISERYPLVEIFSGLLAFLSFIKYGLTTDFIFYFFLFYILLLIGVIDFYSYKIPNYLVLTILLIVLIKTALVESLPLENLATSLTLIFIFIIINKLFRKIKDEEALGYGDVKLLSVLALAVNFPISVIGLWFSSLIAIPGFYLLKLTSKNIIDNRKIPFGLFLSIGYVSTILLNQLIYAGLEYSLNYL